MTASGPEPAATRLRLDVAYDGTDFVGWAAQPGLRSVAGVLTEALTTLLGAVTGLTVAGRTDAGVHATGQVCHVDVPVTRWSQVTAPADRMGAMAPTEALLRRLARLLPADVRVTSVAAVPPTFDARFSALWRRYQYRVCDHPAGALPPRHRDTLSWRYPLDPDALNAASAPMVGEHDFAAYCRRKEHGTTVRMVTEFAWRRDPDGTVVGTVTADAFCQAMVRSMVGALLAVGDGRRPVAWPGTLLARRERAGEVVVAPAHGLTLTAVGYPDDPAQYASRAELARNRRGFTP